MIAANKTKIVFSSFCLLDFQFPCRSCFLLRIVSFEAKMPFIVVALPFSKASLLPFFPSLVMKHFSSSSDRRPSRNYHSTRALRTWNRPRTSLPFSQKITSLGDAGTASDKKILLTFSALAWMRLFLICTNPWNDNRCIWKIAVLCRTVLPCHSLPSTTRNSS